MDSNAVPAPLNVQAFFWTVDISDNEIKDAAKVKCCDVHPELPYVLSVDKGNNIQIWDMFRHNLLMNCSLTVLLQAADQKKKIDVTEDVAKRLKDAGAVVSVRFVDRYALCWTTGKPPTESSSAAFNNNTRVMILCESCLLFYDYASGITHMLSQSELGRPPTAAEFIAPNLCAIGCSDGQVRVWDCLSWSASKALTGHVKGNIIWLRVVCSKSYNATGGERGSLDSSVRGASGDMSMGSMFSIGLNGKEEKPRLLSIGQDGGALLWDLIINDGAVSILGGTPAGHFLSPGCFAQHLDESSDTLYTVQGDRSIRLWDLENIGKDAMGSGKTSRRRSSFFGAAASTDASKVSCVGKAKPRTDLSNPISKFSSCTSLGHPRFPVGTFAVCAKNCAIGIVQIYESVGDGEAMSERSSVTASDSAVMRFNELHLFRMTTVLTAVLMRLVEQNRDVQISPAVVAACRDHNSFKVYSLQAHQMFPHVLVACTSVGVVALSLCAPGTACGEGPRIGTHPAWRTHVMTYTDGTIRYSSLRLAKAPSGGTSARPKSFRRRHHSASIGVSADAPAAAEDAVILETVAELVPSAASLVPGSMAGMPVGLDSSIRGRTSSVTAQNMKVCDLAVISSRPAFYPSCSGMFCVAYWPESHMYVLFKAGLSGLSASTDTASHSSPPRRSLSRGGSNMFSAGEKMVEIERGMCYSLGWVTSSANVDNEESRGDVLCLITPAKRINAPKKRQSIIDNFVSKKKETVPVLPSELVLKRMHADLRVQSLLPEGAPKDATEIIGGGPFLCITTPIISVVGDGKKAVSQIELEAQAIERARNRTASTASLERTDGEDDIKYTVLASEGTILKSQLYRVVFGVSEKKKKKADDAYKKAMAATDEGLASPPLPMPELYLEPVGPVFQRIQAASWDLVSGHVALAMGDTNRVTVLSCGKDRSSFADNVVSVIGSVQLSEGHAPQPLRCFVQHMHWLSGSLFVCSPTCVHVVFIVCFETGTQLKAFPVASLHHTTIDPSRSKSYFGCSLPSRPFGCLESVSISSGCLVVSSPSAAMSALPLTWSPVVVIGLLAGTLNSITTSINLDTVLPWVQVVPSALHAHVYSLYEGLIPKGERNSTFGAVSFKEISALLSTDEDTVHFSEGLSTLDSIFMAASQSGCIEEYSVTAKNYLHSLVLWLSQNTVAPLSDACMAPDDARAVLIKLIDLSLSDISISQSVKLALACMARDLSNDVKCKTENGDQTALSIILERTSELPDTFGDDFKKDAALLESMLPNIMQSSDLRISKFRVTY